MMSYMPPHRLPALLRLVLGGTTEGERLAALAAFEREMQAHNLDLHAVADMLGGKPGDPAYGSPGWPGLASFEQAKTLASEFDDDTWPDTAHWLIAEDDAWHAAHRRYLLSAKQRTFVEEMCESADYLRPTLAQSAWLLLLFEKVRVQRARPEPAHVPLIGQPETGQRARLERPVLPPRRARTTAHRLLGRPDAMEWIVAVTSARRQPSDPKQDKSTQPALFTDAETRVLCWLCGQYRAWLIDRSRKGKDDIIVAGGSRKQPSAVEMAAAATVSLRTVRRALAKAVQAGYLMVEQPGKGRGRRTLYTLTQPVEGWRHHRIPLTRPRRKAASPNAGAETS